MKCRLLLFLAWLLPLAVPQTASATDDIFQLRAAYVDCRTEVRTMNALKKFAREVAKGGMNAIVMEWEATFPFEKNATLCNSLAYSQEEVKDFIRWCGSLGLDVIPLQNCFGHSEYILRHDRYSGLREDRKDPSQVCPLKIKEATDVFRSIFSEVSELHESKYFHIGADETYLLGQCPKCREFAEKYGKSRLFVEYVKAMCSLVREMGKTPVIWADIILEHPEAINDLPKDVVFVDWNYGWDIRHRETIEKLVSEGATFWGATALRSGPDNIYLTQWKKHFMNLVDFVEFAKSMGYSSMIQTSWSTSGTYGYHYDNGYEIINMQPVRLVYPEAGFRILNAATAEAFASKERFDPKNFVRRYALEHLGLTDDGAVTLWEYFCMPQEPVHVKSGKDASGTDISELVTQTQKMLEKIGSLKSKSGKDELTHLSMMLKIRLNYLRFKSIEHRYESPDFRIGDAPALQMELQAVCREGKAVGKEFARLNRGYLKDGEIRHICNEMNEKKEALLDVLSKISSR